MSEKKHEEIALQIAQITQKIENNQNQIISILNEKSSIIADNERFQTMLEQYNIKLAELNSSVIKRKKRGVGSGYSYKGLSG